MKIHQTNNLSSNRSIPSLIPRGFDILGLASINGRDEKHLIFRVTNSQGEKIWKLPIADLVTGEMRSLAIILAEYGHLDLIDRGMLKAVTKAMLQEAQAKGLILLSSSGYQEVQLDGVQYRSYVWDRQAYWLGEQPNSDVIVASGEMPKEKAGNLEDWQNTIGSRLPENHYLIVTFSHALSAALRRAFGKPSLVLILVGPSSIGKTTAQYCAQSIHGPITDVRTMSGTPVGIRELLAANPDVPVFFQDTRQFATPELIDLIFDVADGAARLISGSTKASIASTMILSNERRIIDMPKSKTLGLDEGLYARCLEIDCTAEFGVFHDIHDAPSAAEFAKQLERHSREYYGSVWPAWIDALSENWVEVTQLYEKWEPVVRKKLIKKVGDAANMRVNNRILDALVFSAWAGVIASRLKILPITKDEVIEAYALVLQQTIAQQTNGATPLATSLFEAIKVVLADNSKFNELQFFNRCNGTSSLLGYRTQTKNHGNLYLFMPGVFKRLFITPFGGVAYSLLADAGYLVTSENRGNQFQARIPGTKQRPSFIAIKEAIRYD